MNPRIFDLIKNPEAVQIKDLDLLKNELKKYPYIQNIRALHLYGIHLHQKENYQKELSVTAAYTTDKKILFQFINKKSIAEISAISEPEIAKDLIPETPIENHLRVTESAIETPKPVVIDGVLNRILFEGEEDFWEKEHEVLDIESTLESGTLITQKSTESHTNSIPQNPLTEELVENKFTQEILVKDQENPEIQPEEEIYEAENLETFTPEKIIPELKITEKQEIIQNPTETSFHEIPEFEPESKDLEENFTEVESADHFDKETIIEGENIKDEVPNLEDASQISFHGAQEFLPEVKIVPQKTEMKRSEISSSKQNKQEEEMQRLLSDVEAKMKASKKEKTQKTETEISSNSNINFAETQAFQTEVQIETSPENIVEKEEIQEVIPENVNEQSSEVELPKENVWKPMNFLGNTADSASEKKSPELAPVEKIEELAENDFVEDRPAFNVSFFAPEVSPISPKKEETEIISEKKSPEKSESTVDSNFPKFLNTWQNWLKIERNTEETLPIAAEIQISKETVIENFLQKEPKISKLKEESNFVVKEKDGNISHLMTETLANLYTNQKLYSKAIKAYEILGEKHPDKKDYFTDKILEIKELRKNS